MASSLLKSFSNFHSIIENKSTKNFGNHITSGIKKIKRSINIQRIPCPTSKKTDFSIYVFLLVHSLDHCLNK